MSIWEFGLFVSENLFLIPVFFFRSVVGEAMGGSVGREVLVNNSLNVCLQKLQVESIDPLRALKMNPPWLP